MTKLWKSNKSIGPLPSFLTFTLPFWILLKSQSCKHLWMASSYCTYLRDSPSNFCWWNPCHCDFFKKKTAQDKKKATRRIYDGCTPVPIPSPIPFPHPPKKKGKRDTSLGLFQRFHTSDRFWYAARRYGSAVHRVFRDDFPQAHSEGYLVDCNWSFEAYSQWYWLHDAPPQLGNKASFCNKI